MSSKGRVTRVRSGQAKKNVLKVEVSIKMDSNIKNEPVVAKRGPGRPKKNPEEPKLSPPVAVQKQPKKAAQPKPKKEKPKAKPKAKPKPKPRRIWVKVGETREERAERQKRIRAQLGK